jgi:hypothetical protein
LLARISHSFRREAQREPNRGKEGADFDGGLCEDTQRFAAIAATEKRSHSAQPEERRQSAVKIKPDAANAWLPRAAAENCDKSGLARLLFKILPRQLARSPHNKGTGLQTKQIQPTATAIGLRHPALTSIH